MFRFCFGKNRRYIKKYAGNDFERIKEELRRVLPECPLENAINDMLDPNKNKLKWREYIKLIDIQNEGYNLFDSQTKEEMNNSNSRIYKPGLSKKLYLEN